MKRAHDSDVAVAAEAIHPSRKRRLDYSQADAQLAKIYNDLADDVQAVRIKAAGEVIRNLSAKSDHQIERIEKAIARLIKGLCSGRKAARLGFSIALSEVIRLALDLKASGITLAKLTAKIAEFTTAHVTAGGQERRDYLLGRRFAYQAVLQSGVGSNAAVSSQEWQDFVAALMTLMCEKQWLRRECGAMLYEYLVGVGKGLPADRLQTIVDALHANALWKTPEGVAIWLMLTKSSTKVKLPKGVWQHNDPLSAMKGRLLAKSCRKFQSTTNSKVARLGLDRGRQRLHSHGRSFSRSYMAVHVQRRTSPNSGLKSSSLASFMLHHLPNVKRLDSRYWQWLSLPLHRPCSVSFSHQTSLDAS
jgi:DNA polymerase phi